MKILEFPDVKVDIEHSVSRNPFYVGALGVPVVGECVYLAYALASGVENTGKFLGATIDVYADAARKTPQIPEIWKSSDETYLESLIHEFARDGWVYGVVIDEKYQKEKILKTEKEMDKFLKEGFRYKPEEVDRTIFTPTERYTEHTWGFGYKLKDLEKMVEYKPEKTNEVE